MLKNLQQHFEDEKAQLLALLRSQQNSAAAEQQRQLEMARLKREQRRMEKEDKFDAAATLVITAAQQESIIGAKYVQFDAILIFYRRCFKCFQVFQIKIGTNQILNNIFSDKFEKLQIMVLLLWMKCSC